MKTVSIMPMVNGRKRPDLHHMREAGDDLPDAEVGEIIGDCLRGMLAEGIQAGAEQITLEVKIF